jgi:hypothetical protein
VGNTPPITGNMGGLGSASTPPICAVMGGADSVGSFRRFVGTCALMCSTSTWRGVVCQVGSGRAVSVGHGRVGVTSVFVLGTMVS